MNVKALKYYYWTPRVLCIAFIIYLSLFTAEVFNMEVDGWGTATALSMHLARIAMLLVALAIVWKWDWVGAIIFPLLAVLHFVRTGGKIDWMTSAEVDIPLLAIGILFWLSWNTQEEIHESQMPNASHITGGVRAK